MLIKEETIMPILYRHIRYLINLHDTYQLESGLIWRTLKETLSGADIPNKPDSYNSTEFDEISQKMIISTLKEVFGAVPPKHVANKRELVFNEEILKRFDLVYNLDDNIKIETDE